MAVVTCAWWPFWWLYMVNQPDPTDYAGGSPLILGMEDTLQMQMNKAGP